MKVIIIVILHIFGFAYFGGILLALAFLPHPFAFILLVLLLLGLGIEVPEKFRKYIGLQ